MISNNPFATEIARQEALGLVPIRRPFQPPRSAHHANVISERMATNGQVGYAIDLLAKRDRNAETRDGYRFRLNELAADDAKVRNLTAAQASALIDTLLALPTVVVSDQIAKREHHDVPAGRYAVDTEDGHVAFFIVDRPTEGRWAGYTFVKLQVSDSESNVSRAAAKTILAKIAVDPAAASTRYGREIGRCGVCGRTLTNEASRAAGIGPVCAAASGW